MNLTTTIKTGPAKILDRLRKVNQEIARIVMADRNTRPGKERIKELQAESDQLTREYTAALTCRNAAIIGDNGDG